MPKSEQKFCGVIQSFISVNTCPLKKGMCMWRHRKTGECMCTDEELTPAEFCARVGLDVPSNTELQEIRSAILAALKGDLKNCK